MHKDGVIKGIVNGLEKITSLHKQIPLPITPLLINMPSTAELRRQLEAACAERERAEAEQREAEEKALKELMEFEEEKAEEARRTEEERLRKEAAEKAEKKRRAEETA